MKLKDFAPEIPNRVKHSLDSEYECSFSIWGSRSGRDFSCIAPSSSLESSSSRYYLIIKDTSGLLRPVKRSQFEHISRLVL